MINSAGTQNIADACKAVDCKMLYLSTDYVFDGQKNQPYTEEDEKNPFCAKFIYPTGETFYIEPVFLTQLRGFRDHYKDRYQDILNRIEYLVKRNKKVVFTGNFEFPQTAVDDDYIILEITDVTDPLQIFVEDKSRGSDYGD